MWISNTKDLDVDLDSVFQGVFFSRCFAFTVEIWTQWMLKSVPSQTKIVILTYTPMSPKKGGFFRGHVGF